MSRPRVPDPRNIEVIDEATAAMFRAMTPAQRIEVASNAHRSVRVMLTARVEQLHPDWATYAVHCEVVRRLLGHGSSGLFEVRG